MRLKSYFAGTVEAAMRLARLEMGDDALIMNSRPAPAEARHLGAYEVVVAVDAQAAPPAPPLAAASPDATGLAGEVAQLRRQLDRMADSVSRARPPVAGVWFPQPWLEHAYAELVEADVDPGIALNVVRQLQFNSGAVPVHEQHLAVRAQLAECFAVAGPLIEEERGIEGRKIVALVGPAGAGKTSALVKLAAHYGLSTRRPTQVLSIDTHRVAATEPLRTYCAILGVGFSAYESVGALAQALEEHSRKELVLIDSPGYSEGEIDMAADLARLLEVRREIETHLVLSCATKSADLSRAVDRFARLRPSRLLFTHVDETTTRGAIVSQAARSGLPVSFLSTGPRIPDDLESAQKDRIVDLILGSRAAMRNRTAA
ncbi:MAG: hypothetical protein ACRD96_28425 [Bryobacteraceae bacterium]